MLLKYVIAWLERSFSLQMRLASLRRDEVRLKEEIDAALEQQSQLDKDNYHLRQQTAVRPNY